MINLNTPTKLPPIIKWYVLTKIILIVFIISLPLLFFSKGAWFLVFFLCFVFIGLPAFVYLFLYFKFLTFAVENDKITINSGIIIKRSKSIPFNQVQNVDIIRGLLYRLFGLCKINIWTSSVGQVQFSQKEATRRPDGRLDINTSDGEWLKNFILDKHS